MYVYDDEYLRAIFDDRGGDVLLVTFNEMEFIVHGREYWSNKPAERLGLSAIGIVSKTKNWFPQHSMTALKEVISEILSKFDIVISYGFSQGGYGALKY